MVKKREQVIQAAREMRYEPTEAEKILWGALRGRKLAGLKFHRQHVLGPLIADFYCAAARLVVEVDGDIHDYQKEYDSIRTKHLEDYGYHVIRFKNDMVLNDLENVLSQIKVAAFGRISDLTPDPSPNSGRGESTQHQTLESDSGFSAITPAPSPNIAHENRSRCFGIENVPRSGRGEKAHGADFSPDSE